MTRTTILAALAVLAAGIAQAHEGAPHEAAKPAHGGQLRTAGPFHYELVVAADASEARESRLTVFITDDAGRPVATTGATGTATVLAGKSKATVALLPDGDNRMKGLGRYAAGPAMKVVVSLALAGKPAEQARFTPLAAP